MSSFESLVWFKSSYSGDEGGACVEVAFGDGAVHVRDSKAPDGPAITVTPDAWRSFIRAAAQSGRP